MKTFTKITKIAILLGILSLIISVVYAQNEEKQKGKNKEAGEGKGKAKQGQMMSGMHAGNPEGRMGMGMGMGNRIGAEGEEGGDPFRAIYMLPSLTDEQKGKLNTLREAFVKDTEPLVEKMKKTVEEIKAIMESDPKTPDEIKAKHKEMSDTRLLLANKRIDAMFDIKNNILTPAQVKEAKELRKEHQARQGDRRNMMNDRMNRRGNPGAPADENPSDEVPAPPAPPAEDSK